MLIHLHHIKICTLPLFQRTIAGDKYFETDWSNFY
jgi:hypothetical protein